MGFTLFFINTVAFLFIWFFSSHNTHASVSCPFEDVENSYSITKHFCNSSGELIRAERLFKKTLKHSTIQHFKDGLLVAKSTFNLEQEQIKDLKYEYNENGTYYNLGFVIGSNPKILNEKSLRSGTPLGENQELSVWRFKRDKKTNLLEIDYVNHYDKKRNLISKRDVYSKNLYEGTYEFIYPDDPTKFKYADGFNFYDHHGEFRRSYSYLENFAPLKLRRSFKFHLAVIDSGFEVHHPALIQKWSYNPDEKLDGVDNDLNGIADDLIGWSADEIGGFNNNINERVAVSVHPRTKFPFSHGTHTSTIALRNSQNTGLFGFAGNMGDAKHLKKISSFMKRNNIRFSNMSFSFGDKKSPFAPGSRSYRALYDLIQSNPQSLFAVAAGNNKQDLDREDQSFKEYPASFDLSNILSVGALNTNEFNENKASTYKPAYFSTYGRASVDIFAPGDNVLGGNLGGYYVRTSGTSMAAPFALNSAILIAETYPKLNSLQLKDILLYSAYIPNIDEPLDCTSGGMLFFRRALETAKLVAEEKLNVKEAALKLRQKKEFILEGEELSQDYLNTLEKLWESRL